MCIPLFFLHTVADFLTKGNYDKAVAMTMHKAALHECMNAKRRLGLLLNRTGTQKEATVVFMIECQNGIIWDAPTCHDFDMWTRLVD